MPAAAVIPAPIAYIKVVAVKKLVVGCVAVLRFLFDFSELPSLGETSVALVCRVGDSHHLL